MMGKINNKTIRKHTAMLVAVILGCLALTTCYTPQVIWPQRDILASGQNDPSLQKRVLVASRSSEYKDAVVEKIREAFKNERVYFKFIGIEDLEAENGSDYSAVVMISTCMGWTLDRVVNDFLNRHDDQGNMILLTTSGNGGWVPELKGRNFDAVSAASLMGQIDMVAGYIAGKIQKLLLGN